MTAMVQRSMVYHCAMLRNVGTGPQGVVGGEGEEGGGVVGGGLVRWPVSAIPSHFRETHRAKLVFCPRRTAIST